MDLPQPVSKVCEKCLTPVESYGDLFYAPFGWGFICEKCWKIYIKTVLKEANHES